MILCNIDTVSSNFCSIPGEKTKHQSIDVYLRLILSTTMGGSTTRTIDRNQNLNNILFN